jgi:hypothetical protein
VSAVVSVVALYSQIAEDILSICIRPITEENRVIELGSVIVTRLDHQRAGLPDLLLEVAVAVSGVSYMVHTPLHVDM